MIDAEIEEVLGLLESGATLRVPMQTPLYPETMADRSTLFRVGADSYVLRTYFREHAPGHGWSCEQTEEEPMDRATLRMRLATVERGAIGRE